MNDRTVCAPAGTPAKALQKSFCTTVLPVVERHARIAFRHERCQNKKADRVSECVALCWKWFCRLNEQGKDATQFSSVLADFAARHVRAGRRLCGKEAARDAMSGVAQREHGFALEKLPDYSTLSNNPVQEALIDDTQTPVPDQVAFRQDFPAWLARWSERDRHMILDLAQGERTLDTSKKYHISPGRVSQRRREYHADWERFHGMAA